MVANTKWHDVATASREDGRPAPAIGFVANSFLMRMKREVGRQRAFATGWHVNVKVEVDAKSFQ